MEERKTFEVIELQGRKFVIRMFPAAEGLAILKELMTRALPMDLLSNVAIGGQSVGEKLKGFGFDNSKSAMSIDEFAAFEKRLLTCVDARLKDGDEQIINEDGTYNVVDIEYNLSLVMKLLLEVVRVNYKDFFVDSLKELKVLKGITEAKAEEIKESLV